MKSLYTPRVRVTHIHPRACSMYCARVRTCARRKRDRDWEPLYSRRAYELFIPPGRRAYRFDGYRPIIRPIFGTDDRIWTFVLCQFFFFPLFLHSPFFLVFSSFSAAPTCTREQGLRMNRTRLQTFSLEISISCTNEIRSLNSRCNKQLAHSSSIRDEYLWVESWIFCSATDQRKQFL